MFASSFPKNLVCMLLAVVIVTASLAVGAMGIQSLETHASVVISA